MWHFVEIATRSLEHRAVAMSPSKRMIPPRQTLGKELIQTGHNFIKGLCPSSFQVMLSLALRGPYGPRLGPQSPIRLQYEQIVGVKVSIGATGTLGIHGFWDDFLVFWVFSDFLVKY